MLLNWGYKISKKYIYIYIYIYINININGFKFKYCRFNYYYYIMKSIILYIKYFLLFH
jgi:hypothetical protein